MSNENDLLKWNIRKTKYSNTKETSELNILSLLLLHMTLIIYGAKKSQTMCRQWDEKKRRPNSSSNLIYQIHVRARCQFSAFLCISFLFFLLKIRLQRIDCVICEIDQRVKWWFVEKDSHREIWSEETSALRWNGFASSSWMHWNYFWLDKQNN